METGCYIDGSHWSSFDFITAVIKFAVSRGFEIDTKQFEDDLLWLENFGDGVSDDEDMLLDVYDALDWTYQDALDYLNDTAPDNLIWTVEDQSLFLEEGADD